MEKYLKAYTTALRSQFRDLWYIDAFAGTGHRAIKHQAVAGDWISEEQPERIEYRRGSALIAIEVEPKFDRLIFLEKKPAHCAALEELKAQYPDRNITIVREDANTSIRSNIQWDGWKKARAVMFLDPYGMNVEWATLETIAKTQAVDVWYLVSLSGLFRQATINPENLDDSKRNALTRMLGTDEWLRAWYTEHIEEDMFGTVPRRQTFRWADVTAMERFVGERLRTIFPEVLPPLRLHNERNVPMFALFFAISNPSPRAIGLARNIAGHILKGAGISS